MFEIYNSLNEIVSLRIVSGFGVRRKPSNRFILHYGNAIMVRASGNIITGPIEMAFGGNRGSKDAGAR